MKRPQRLSKRDGETLAELVGRYGGERLKRWVDKIDSAAATLEPGKPGRPSFNPGYGRWAVYWAAVEDKRDKGRLSVTAAADIVRKKVGGNGFPSLSTKRLADIYSEQERRREADPEYASFLKYVLGKHQWIQSQMVRDPNRIWLVPLSIMRTGVERWGLEQPGYKRRNKVPH